MASDRALVAAARTRLAERADAEKAPAMRAYMKSELPYRGVPTPPLRRMCRELFREFPLADRTTWTDTVLDLWHHAEFREERYVARELTGHPAYEPWQDPDTMPLYRELITTGAWWDLVDDIAIRRVGPIRRRSDAEVTPIVREWSVNDDKWLRRTAIICQVGARADTDRTLLAELIEPSLTSTDFFLRKAIGWALRDLAWHDPSWVVSYVDRTQLSGLSRREALKNIR